MVTATFGFAAAKTVPAVAVLGIVVLGFFAWLDSYSATGDARPHSADPSTPRTRLLGLGRPPRRGRRIPDRRRRSDRPERVIAFAEAGISRNCPSWSLRPVDEVERSSSTPRDEGLAVISRQGDGAELEDRCTLLHTDLARPPLLIGHP